MEDRIRVFDDLQDRMEERACEFKDSKAFNPFYEFVIGNITYKECVKQVAEFFHNEE
jgi:hypothetical protein